MATQFEVTRAPHESDSRQTVWHVRVGGELVGRVKKFADTRTAHHPYQAFGLAPAGTIAANPHLGNVFAVRAGWGNPEPGCDDDRMVCDTPRNARMTAAQIVANVA